MVLVMFTIMRHLLDQLNFADINGKVRIPPDFWTMTLEQREQTARELLPPLPSCETTRPDPSPIVAIYSRSLRPQSGGLLSLRSLAETFHERGYTVWGLSRDGRDSFATMRMFKVVPDRMLESFAQLPGTPDVIICNPVDVSFVQPLAKTLGIPFIVYVQFWRGWMPIEPDVLRRLDSDTLPVEAFDHPNIERTADAAAVVANSEYTAGITERIIGRKCDVVAQPYIGNYGLNGHARRPTYVVLPSPQWGKGAARFFTLARDNPDVPFLLLAGDVMHNVGVIEAANKIPNVTVQPDWVEDMRPIYARARALFLGTDTCETFSRAAAEARACGVPILALRAGNLPNIVRDDGGVCVPRDASDDDWQTAFEKVLTMSPKPTSDFAHDHRARMVDVADDVRNLSEVYMPLPYAPGIRAVVEHAARVLGVTVLPWDAPAKQFSPAKLIVCPWAVPDRLLRLGKPTLLWWHSHCVQMDITRSELTAIAKAWECVAATPHLSIAFGHQAEAEMWDQIHPGRSHHLPACLDCHEVTVPKTGGVFIPGPYGMRKNTPTALAACRLADRVAHVTGRIREHDDLLRFAVALDLRLQIHECESVPDVQAVAGACDVALMLSTAETYCYAAAECVLSGTPVIGWAGLPALAVSPVRPWFVDPTDVRDVARTIGTVEDHWHSWQLADLKSVADDRAVVARRTLLERLSHVL